MAMKSMHRIGRGPTWVAAGDLTDPAAIDRLAAEATARLDGVDLLIYAAGVDTIAATIDQSTSRSGISLR